MKTLILALDVSTTTTGYAIVSPTSVIEYGQFSIKDRTLSDTMYAVAITDKIMNLTKLKGIGDIIVEDVYCANNAAYFKRWSKVHGAIGYAWYKRHKKEPEFMMASAARPKIGIKGNAKKIEVQLEIARRFNLIGTVVLDEFDKKLSDLFDRLKIIKDKKRIATAKCKKKEIKKTELNKIVSDLKKESGKVNYQFKKISDKFETETGFSEHIADSIVLGLASFK